MQSPQIQINMHRPNSWVYSEFGIKALALMLRSGISVTRPDPKVDAQLQMSSSGMYQGGTIKVIVAGLPRTATMSMKKALEELGYQNCFHLAEPLCQFSNLRLSADIINTKDTALRRRKLARLLHGHEATLEVPGSACLPDLLEMYPNAKVILTGRASARVWLRSWRGFGVDLRSDCFRWIGYWVPGVVSANDLYRGWVRLASERFGLAPEPSEQLYHAHNNWVKEIVPRERLLVFNCQDGWTPLCEFLGRQRPNPFPHGNEAGNLKFYKRAALLLGIFLWLVVLAIGFMLALLCTA